LIICTQLRDRTWRRRGNQSKYEPHTLSQGFQETFSFLSRGSKEEEN
jgi:hypothetical protein